VLLILSRLFRATISVFFVPFCPILLSFYLVLSYMFELNKINGDGEKGIASVTTLIVYQVCRDVGGCV